ncbi:predicted protein [Lichtheimia corymbifera JMRC:FSU:9682]|uniref:UspA domain-containing protein n=1 Tax=Lichtheimia corymbifera JMRC:FSU:9682 TaxID=1263082 RepID=A0A068SAD5_9FUNG|nr:predicted protein [Lichtheimia corymbifera JMRC:FSU:9682]
MIKNTKTADDTPVSRKAISYGLRLHESIPQSSIQFVFAVGLNPTSNTSINLLGSLDRTNNLEIEHDAQNTENALRQRLPDKADLQVITGEQSVEKLIEDFINSNPPDMLIMGSSNRTGLEKWVLGSVSDHCIHHCHCPVTIIKA